MKKDEYLSRLNAKIILFYILSSIWAIIVSWVMSPAPVSESVNGLNPNSLLFLQRRLSRGDRPKKFQNGDEVFRV